MSSRRRLLLYGYGAATAVVATSRPARAAITKLEIGYVPSTLFAPVFVAAERGYFEEEGFDVDLTPIVAGQDAMALAATGRLDLVAAALSAAFYNAVARDLDVRLVGVDCIPTQTRTSQRPHGARRLYGNPERARCKRCGARRSAGSAAQQSPRTMSRVLRPAGLTLNDVESVEYRESGSGRRAAAQGDGCRLHLIARSPKRLHATIWHARLVIRPPASPARGSSSPKPY